MVTGMLMTAVMTPVAIFPRPIAVIGIVVVVIIIPDFRAECPSMAVMTMMSVMTASPAAASPRAAAAVAYRAEAGSAWASMATAARTAAMTAAATTSPAATSAASPGAAVHEDQLPWGPARPLAFGADSPIWSIRSCMDSQTVE
jgi:hypothetical protein